MYYTSHDIAGMECNRSQVISGMGHTSQVIAGMEYVSQDIAGMDYICHVIAGMDHKSQVIPGMEYLSQVIMNCFQAILQLLSAQFSQSDARYRLTNNFTSAGAKMRTCNLTRHDTKSQDIAGMDFSTCQVITGMVYISHDIAGMECGVQAITVMDFCDEART